MPNNPGIQPQSRKRTIQATVQGAQQATFHPDISAGVCDFCGHPPYRCPSCKTKLVQSAPDKEGICRFPPICPNHACMKPIPQEAIDPLAFCEHYRELKEELMCVFCRDKNALFFRKVKVRGIEKPDGSEELVLVCSDIKCRMKFQERYAGRAY